MTTFFIQTENNKITHDFAFHLERAVDYYRNFLMDQYYDVIYTLEDDFIETDDVRIVPIGSVQFVHSFMEKIGVKPPKPINIPPHLRYPQFLGRYHAVVGSNENEFSLMDMADDYFIGGFYKDSIRIKGISGIIEENTKLPRGSYHLTSPIGILAEYRVFVMNDEILDVRRYMGEWDIAPSMGAVKLMIKEYNKHQEAPCVYTLDVAVTQKCETVVMEVHNFYSCGLYGFSDYMKLPVMFARWWIENVKRGLRNEREIK